MGKLSDEDYQQTKRDLQRELAGVVAGIEGTAPAPAPGNLFPLRRRFRIAARIAARRFPRP